MSAIAPHGAHRCAVIEPGLPLYLSGRPPWEIVQTAVAELGALFVLASFPLMDAGRNLGRIELHSSDPDDTIAHRDDDLVCLRREATARLLGALALDTLAGIDASFGAASGLAAHC